MKYSLLAFAGLGSAVSYGADQPSSGGYGVEHLTKDKHAPIQRQMDDATLLKLRKVSDFEQLVKKERPQGWGLNENSEFLSFEGQATLVPKHAIIHVPDPLRGCVTASLQGKYVPWKEFATRYPGLVTTFDVTLEEVTGKKPIEPKSLELLRKMDRVVVAVLNGAPISCRLPAPAPAATPAD